MKRILIFLQLYFLSFLTFAQIASIEKAVPAELIAKKGSLTNFKALDFMKEPYNLLDYWGDEVLSVSKYSSIEQDFQKKLNEKLSADFIMAYSPVGQEQFSGDNYFLPIESRHIDNEEITPYTWKWVHFEIHYEDGAIDEVKLCRPNWWLKNTGATKINDKVYLDIPETGISGLATITKILPCQLDTRLLKENRKSDYRARPVTGIFKHDGGQVWDYYFSEGEPIGATANHPFYSLDRQAYIPVGELEIGEKVKTISDKEIYLVRKEKRAKSESVYKIEIYRDHNYSVGKEGVLAHNACWTEKFNVFVEIWKHDPNYKSLFKSANTVINYISASDLALFKTRKETNWAKWENKNIAKVNYEVNIGGQTKTGNYIAIAGYTDPNRGLPNIPGGLPPPSDATSIFKGSTFTFGPLPRGNDSEVKILDKIASEFGATSISQRFPNATGKETIVTELFPCGSCAKIINQFQVMFPKIELEIFAQAKNSFTP